MFAYDKLQEGIIMSNESVYTMEVNADDFYQNVVEASHEKVIVVDFWADWCAPCKVLGPLLDKVVASFGGRVILAKVNIEQNQELAVHYKVQSIPSVKIFSKGEVAQEFVGALPENQIVSIITSVAGDEHSDILHQADTYLNEGKVSKAEALYKSMLTETADQSGALIGLARIAIMNGDTDQAGDFLSQVSEMDDRHEEAQSLRETLDFIQVCYASGGIENCVSHAESNADDLEAHYNLGCCYAANKSYEKALDTFLTVVKRDSHYGDGKARNAMLTLFTVLGQDSDLTKKYRDLLARALF